MEMQPADYILAVNVSVGSVLFLLSGSVASARARAGTHSTLYGLVLMLTYLAFDGFTSTFQDKLFRGYSMSSSNQILYTTLISSAIGFFGEHHSAARDNKGVKHNIHHTHAQLCLCAGLVMSGQLAPALAFLVRHPESAYFILLLSISASAGEGIPCEAQFAFCLLLHPHSRPICRSRQYVICSCSERVISECPWWCFLLKYESILPDDAGTFNRLSGSLVAMPSTYGLRD